MKRRLKPTLLSSVFFVLLLLVAAFQACSGAGVRESSESSSGNGSGYGGKLRPGRYYAATSSATCVSQPGSNVSGILHVQENGSVIYYDSCEEVGGVPVEPSEVTAVDAFSDVISFNDADLSFERFETRPTFVPADRILEAVCYATPGVPHLSLQVIVRGAASATPTTHATEVHYQSLALPNPALTGISTGGTGVLRFASEFDGADPQRSRYVRSSNPAFDVRIEGNGWSLASPLALGGRLQMEIDGKPVDYQLSFCFFNRGPR